MRDLAIYGAGGFGREVFCLINKINSVHPTWNVIGFFDDGIDEGKTISHYGKVIGGLDCLNQWKSELDVVLAIGNVTFLKKISEGITNPLISFPNIIHPEAVFTDEPSFTIGKGNIIQRASAFSCDVVIGNFNVFNGGTVLGHDVVLGDCNVLMPATRVSGGTKIGNCNFLGISSIVLQGLKIGDNIKLGAGSVLMTKPKDGNLYMGNPAKKVVF